MRVFRGLRPIHPPHVIAEKMAAKMTVEEIASVFQASDSRSACWGFSPLHCCRHCRKRPAQLWAVSSAAASDAFRDA